MSARVVCAATIVMGLALGCGHEPDTDDKGAAPSQAAPAQPAAVDEASARVQLDEPAGWTRSARARWSIRTSPDGRSRFATGGLAPGEVVSKLVADAAAELGASNLQLLDPQEAPFGADKLPSQAADGSCRFGSGEGRIGYSAIDLGGGARVLVVHVAAADVSEETKRAALAAIGTLRRR